MFEIKPPDNFPVLLFITLLFDISEEIVSIVATPPVLMVFEIKPPNNFPVPLFKISLFDIFEEIESIVAVPLVVTLFEIKPPNESLFEFKTTLFSLISPVISPMVAVASAFCSTKLPINPPLTKGPVIIFFVILLLIVSVFTVPRKA